MNPYDKYNNNRILSASPNALILMLYDGAIKFGNIAKKAIEDKDIETAHKNIIKIENIFKELLNCLDDKYPVSKDFRIVYENIINLLIKANVSKNPADIENVMIEIREIRDIWKKITKI